MRLNRKVKIGAMGVLGMLSILGVIVAQQVTKPMNVNLQTHIQVCKKSASGSWEAVDELGPANLQFQASLADLAGSKKLSSDFAWNTTSKKGVAYSVRLSQPASISFNPLSGQMDGDVKFDVTWNGKKALVTGHLTTESVAGPVGSVKGARARGILGNDPITATLVSANDLVIPGEAEPLKLVCTESYTLTPKK